ncbi:MAG: MFS transporter [Clostridia bacterium]|nr:MFS transporter [Clostridia bacterium]
MERSKRLQMTGFTAFFLSGICAISSGVIVSILQEIHQFSYGTTGTLLSLMSVGNMAASFAAGILPAKIGTRATVLSLCAGYCIGYLMMSSAGLVGLLMAAFLIVGLAKGCALNTCTVLVGSNSPDRTRGLSIMHACYASGALICPFVIAGLLKFNNRLPMIALSVAGVVLWIVLMMAKLPGKASAGGSGKRIQQSFLKDKKFWLITALIFCQNAAETSVTGWLVTYYNNQQILSGMMSSYTVTIMWGGTLIARLLIAFVFPVRDTFKALTIMGLGCTLLYAAMIISATPLSAILMLFAFAFAMAGVNPVAVAGTGKILSAESMGIMLPVAGTGAIIMPWLIGIVADNVSLQAGMRLNLLPCVGIMVLSLIISKLK